MPVCFASFRSTCGAILGTVILSVANPAAAEDFDWNRTASRQRIDTAFRNFSSECGKLGFTVQTPLAPDLMEKRIFSKLLLVSQFEADAIVGRWAGHIKAMTQLGDREYTDVAAADAGAALAAGAVDPSVHDEAKEKYVAAFIGAAKPFLRACTEVVADPFLGQHYLSGSGSLDVLEKTTRDHFEVDVLEMRK